MEYERIQMVQKTGMISPTKLRMMKLMGPHRNRKKDKSNSNSSRTSPSRFELEDSKFDNNSLLSSANDFEDEANVPSQTVVDHSQTAISNHPKERVETENEEMGYIKPMQSTKGELNSIHSMRTPEDENLDYDSNASSSSFEFQEGEKSTHNSVSRSYSRPMPSKWNDAEKWIMTRQNRSSKTNATLSGLGNRTPAAGVAMESANCDQNKQKSESGMMMANRVVDTKRVDFCQPVQHAIEKKHSFIPSKHSSEDQPVKNNDGRERSCTKSLSEETIVVPAIRSVCMRDMGTEMTPATSLEPSRTATPEGSRTPFRSPPSSMPSTPRGREAPASSPTVVEAETRGDQYEIAKRAFSEQELKEKTKREIVALGVQLGKMNIAAWASKEEPWDANGTDFGGKVTNAEELERIEFGKRAMAWEEAEISKHNARYKREELKLQAWESQQKAKLEAEMRRVEAKVEQMRAQVQAKTVKRIAMAKQRAEEKRAAAKARKNRDAERAAAQAEYIRQTGKLPSSNFMCCGWTL